MTLSGYTWLRRRVRAYAPGDWLRAAVIFCAALAVALALLARLTTPAPDQARALIGQPAPSFTLAATQSGQTLARPVSFSGRASQPTLLVFFNTLCVHCVAGVQMAQAVARATGAPAVTVIYLDSPGENAQITGQYMARLRYDPPVLLDVGARVASRYGVAYYPSVILVDAQGIVRAAWTGAPSVAAAQAAIAASR